MQSIIDKYEAGLLLDRFAIACFSLFLYAFNGEGMRKIVSVQFAICHVPQQLHFDSAVMQRKLPFIGSLITVSVFPLRMVIKSMRIHRTLLIGKSSN